MDLRGVFGEGFALPLFVVVSFLTGLDASGVTSLFRFVGGAGGGGPIGGTTERGDLEEEMNDILWLRTAFHA